MPGNRRPQRRRWTFLVYMIGGPELAPSIDRDIVELQRYGSSADVSVVVARQASANDPADWLEIQPLVPKRPAPAPVKVGGTGQNAVKLDDKIAAFLEHARIHYPADHVALIFWAHASGLQFGAPNGTGAAQVLRLRELGKLLAETNRKRRRRLDLLGFCACAVSKAEYVVELARHAGYLVASQIDISTLMTWPFDRIVSELLITPEMSPKRLARVIVHKHESFYAPPPIALTAIDLHARNRLEGLVDKLARALRAAISPKNPSSSYNNLLVLLAFSQSLKAYPYDGEDLIDILDFSANIVRAVALDARARRVANDIVEMGPSKLMLANARSGPDSSSLNGLSITAPNFYDKKWGALVTSRSNRASSQLWQQTDWLRLLSEVHRFAMKNPKYLR